MKFGILGAAKIAPMALVRPASEVDGVEVVAVAARDGNKAAKFAAKHNIDRAYDSYEALLADEQIDAVYIPLPNGLHGEWTIKALAAGKHVLCEKPFTANAAEAKNVASVADESGLIVMEAFHWRYHRMAERIGQIIASGEIGDVQHIEMAMCFPLPLFSDIRWQWDLAGGSLMDAGCYCVSITRFLAGAEMATQPEVVYAKSKTLSGGNIDRWTTADLAFKNGVTAKVTAAMWSSSLLKLKAKIIGSRGEVHVLNPVLPQLFNRITVKAGGKRRTEKVEGETSYTAQLRAFKAAVGGDAAKNITNTQYAITNMSILDEIYQKAGLPLRQSFADISI